MMSNWKPLERCANIIMGQSPDSSSYNETNGTSFLQGCSEFGQKTPNSRIFTNLPNKIARKDSILISVRAPVGTTNLADKDYCIGRGLASIYEINNTSTNEFLRYTIQHSIPLLLQKAQGSTFEAINSNDLKRLKVYCPDLPIQKRIAKILSTVDGQIEKTDAIIAKYQAIKQGMLHDLFTRGIDLSTGKLRPTPEQDHKLYKLSPLGLIPKDWNYKTLKNITLVNQGLQIPISSRYKDYKDNRYLYITIQLLNNPTDESYTYYIDNPPISVVCKTQDVLMVRTGNTGAVITNIAGCFHNNFFKIDYNSEYTNRDFLVQYLNLQHIQEKIMSYAGTTTIPDLKHGDFYKLPYLEPKPEEQKYISAKINKIDMLIASENKTLEKLQKLKQGLMSKLLNGDV